MLIPLPKLLDMTYLTKIISDTISGFSLITHSVKSKKGVIKKYELVDFLDRILVLKESIVKLKLCFENEMPDYTINLRDYIWGFSRNMLDLIIIIQKMNKAVLEVLSPGISKQLHICIGFDQFHCDNILDNLTDYQLDLPIKKIEKIKKKTMKAFNDIERYSSSSAWIKLLDAELIENPQKTFIGLNSLYNILGELELSIRNIVSETDLKKKLIE